MRWSIPRALVFIVAYLLGTADVRLLVAFFVTLTLLLYCWSFVAKEPVT